MNEPNFYYCAKVSSSERDAGCEHIHWKRVDGEWVRVDKSEFQLLEDLKFVLEVLTEAEIDTESVDSNEWPWRFKGPQHVRSVSSAVGDADPSDPNVMRYVSSMVDAESEDDGDYPIDPSDYRRPSDIPRLVKGCIHPTVKPVELMEVLVERVASEGDVVLDPFAGSGTTGVAAVNVGVDARLIEMDENGKYEDIIRGRLSHAGRRKIEDTPVWEDPPELDLPENEAAGDVDDFWEQEGFDF